MWDRKELKQRGKAAFKANYWKCVLPAFLLALFVTGGVSSGSRVTYNLNNSSQSTATMILRFRRTKVISATSARNNRIRSRFHGQWALGI